MIDNYKIAFKKGYKYYTGKYVAGKIKKGKEFKSLSEIPKFDKYITFKRYLRLHKIKDVDPEQFYGNLNISSLYILDTSEKVQNHIEVKTAPSSSTVFSDEMTKGAWERQWFKIKNKLCMDCTKKCKQSVYLDIVYCPFYNTKEKK